jgi:hypothetical protein
MKHGPIKTRFSEYEFEPAFLHVFTEDSRLAKIRRITSMTISLIMYVYEQVYDEHLMKICKWRFAWVFIDKISASLFLIFATYLKIENNGFSVKFCTEPDRARNTSPTQRKHNLNNTHAAA